VAGLAELDIVMESRPRAAGTVPPPMATVAPLSHRPSRLQSLALQARYVRVIAKTEFKLKYADSALGYVWSLVKPLVYFAVLLAVFGSFFKLNATFENYPIYLLVGIVMFTFFADATSMTMLSFVVRASLLGKLAFPRVVIPLSTTTVATLTFLINLTAVAAFVAWYGIVPHPSWLLLPLLLLELYVFTFGVALILAVLFVRFRDVGQVWELAVQLLFYVTPIIYPVSYLPAGLQPIALLNPLAQVIQDVRSIILYNAPTGSIVTAPDVLGPGGRIYPIAITLAVMGMAWLLYRREAPWLAERI
jgi:ABC-2 type transport system permease protein